MSRIILASASPRRRELLQQIGLRFEIMPSHKEEVMRGQTPSENVMGLAEDKARDIFEKLPEGMRKDVLVIGADTVVSLDGKILGKPKDATDALSMLRFLQGNTHQVYTGVCLVTAESTQVFYEKTDVTMYEASDEELEAYIRSGEPMDKAGSYGIQGLGTILVREIHGDYNNVVGLPVSAIWQRLTKNEITRKFVIDNKE